MTRQFDEAEERARLAAWDLETTANQVIRRRSITWATAQDDVDFQELSRWTRYLPLPKFDHAREGLEFVTRVREEIAGIQSSLSALAAGQAGDPAAEKDAIRRLDALADECQRRAIALRS
jgi:hypothetical protein